MTSLQRPGPSGTTWGRFVAVSLPCVRNVSFSGLKQLKGLNGTDLSSTKSLPHPQSMRLSAAHLFTLSSAWLSAGVHEGKMFNVVVDVLFVFNLSHLFSCSLFLLAFSVSIFYDPIVSPWLYYWML